MAGYDLTSGELQYVALNEDKLWSKFNYVFSESSRKRSTYKFGFLKSILDNLLNCTIVNDEFVLYYHDIFAKFTENYWNLILKYHLKQMRSDGKSEYSTIKPHFSASLSHGVIGIVRGVRLNVPYTNTCSYLCGNTFCPPTG